MPAFVGSLNQHSVLGGAPLRVWGTRGGYAVDEPVAGVAPTVTVAEEPSVAIASLRTKPSQMTVLQRSSYVEEVEAFT